MFFTDFSGITVEQATELRSEFRKLGIDYKVVKNTLARKALESVTGYDAVYKSLAGPTGIAFSYDDPVTPAKIIKKFHDKNEKLSCKACVIDKQVFDGSKLDELSKLPSRNEIIAGILGSHPGSGFRHCRRDQRRHAGSRRRYRCDRKEESRLIFFSEQSEI